MGASTAVLCEKIRDAAKDEGEEIEIWATALSVAGEEIPKADVILLGPQIRYMQRKVQSEAGDTPVRAIDMTVYGQLDGKSVYQMVKDMRKKDELPREIRGDLFPDHLSSRNSQELFPGSDRSRQSQ